MSGSTQTDGDAQNDNNEAAANDDAQQQLAEAQAVAGDGSSHQDGGNAMSQSQKSQATVDEFLNYLVDSVVVPLKDAQEEAEDEYGESANVNAAISVGEDGLTHEVLELTDGVPDEAIHIGGISAIVAGTNRQFTDSTALTSVHYEAKDVMNEANDDDSLNFSANYVEGTSMWMVIPTPTEGTGGPTIEDAVADLIEETLNSGLSIAVPADGAQDLLEADLRDE